MQNVLEQGPDFWCWFNKTQFSYHCVYPIHATMFSIQMLLHFSQIAQRVCTLVLFITDITIYIIMKLSYGLTILLITLLVANSSSESSFIDIIIIYFNIIVIS